MNRHTSQNLKTPNHKVPPHNLEVEKVILCCCIINPGYSIPICMEQIESDDFYRESHRYIFESIIQSRDVIIDGDSIVIIAEDLSRNDLLEKAGGQEYLMSLVDMVSSSSSIQHYIEILLEKSRQRKYLELANVINGNIGISSSQEVNDLILDYLNKIKSRDEGQTPILSMKNSLHQTFRELEMLSEIQNGMTGIPSGFIDVDHRTKGWQNGDLIIIAGRPGMGKSVFVKDCAEASEVPVLYFPIEMSVSQTQKRQIAGYADVSFEKILSGMLTDQDWQRIVTAVSQLSERPIFYVNKGHLSIEEIVAISKQAFRKHGIKMVIIDYLQLLRTKSKAENREQEISKISMQLKGLARDLNIPVIAVSQLNRSCENRSNKRPMLSDLRESGAIEQDADIVGLLYRSEYYKKVNNDERNVAELIIAKGRNIKTGMVKLYFNGEYQKFGNYFYDDTF